MGNETKIEILYQILDDDFSIDVRDWCDSDLGRIAGLINGIAELRNKGVR